MQIVRIALYLCIAMSLRALQPLKKKQMVSGRFYDSKNAPGCVHLFYLWERFDHGSVIALIGVQALRGLLMGFSMAYFDSVLKSHGSALATVLSAFVAYMKNDFRFTWISVICIVLVLFSSYLFNFAEKPGQRKRAVN